MSRRGLFSFALATNILCASSFAWAEDQTPAFSWTLPKTVLDVSITYEYVDCVIFNLSKQYKIKVTPTVVARAIPDPEWGFRTQSTGDLKAGWQDNDITITTFANSHILKTISSHPVGEGATIISNVLSGIGKIVAVALGVGAAGEVTEPKCLSEELLNPMNHL